MYMYQITYQNDFYDFRNIFTFIQCYGTLIEIDSRRVPRGGHKSKIKQTLTNERSLNIEIEFTNKKRHELWNSSITVEVVTKYFQMKILF